MRKLASILFIASVSAFAFSEVPGLPDSIIVDRNISYDQYPQTVLDVFQPHNSPPGKRPGVLLIHGGGWVGGSKDNVAAVFGLPYLQRGFVVANVDYRLADVAPAPAAITDVLNAARWFRSHARKYNVDPKRIIIAGDSAGGYLALMAGMAPRSAKLGPRTKLAAVVNFYGITDLGDQLEGPNMRDYAVKWIPEQPDRRMLAHRLSPLTYVRKKLPPILTIHGDEDQVVPYDHSIMLTKALVTVKSPVEMIPIRRGQHGFSPQELVVIYREIFDFLRRYKVLPE